MKKILRMSFLVIIIIVLVVIINVYQIYFFSKENDKKTYIDVYNKGYNQLISILKKIQYSDKNIDEVKESLQNESDSFKRGIYNHALAIYYSDKEEYFNAEWYVKEASKNYEDSQNTILLSIHLYTDFAEHLMSRGEYKKSLRYCYYILNDIIEVKNAELSNDLIEEADVVVNCLFLQLFSEYGIREKADEYFKNLESLNASQKVTSKTKKIICYSKLKYFFYIKDSVNAEKYSIEFYDIEKEEPISCEECSKLNLVAAKMMNGDLKNVENYLNDAYNCFKKKNNYISIAKTYFVFGQYYEYLGMYDKAKTYYEDSLKIFKETKYDWGIHYVLLNIIHLDGITDTKLGLEEYYKECTKFFLRTDLNSDLKQIISEVMDVNEELHNKKLELIQIQNANVLSKIEFLKQLLKLFLVILIIMCLVFYITYKCYLNKKAKEIILQEALNKDNLTKSFSRLYGYEKIKHNMECNVSFYLCIIDIDDFKKVNDTYGHVFGDEVLKKVCDIVKCILKGSDFIARFGGEEFIIIVHTDDEKEAIETYENIRQAIENIKWVYEVKVTISMGMAKYKGEELNTLIDKADNLLYKAKKSGKNNLKY